MNEALSDMYELLQEEDMWSGLWLKCAKYRETNIAIAYEQQGFYEQAQVSAHYYNRYYLKRKKTILINCKRQRKFLKCKISNSNSSLMKVNIYHQ